MKSFVAAILPALITEAQAMYDWTGKGATIMAADGKTVYL